MKMKAVVFDVFARDVFTRDVVLFLSRDPLSRETLSRGKTHPAHSDSW
jgi:hypothetical protein